MKEIRENNLAANATRQGARLRAAIESWKLPVVTEIRGLGLLFGIGLDPTRIEVGEGETAALKIVKSLIAKGLITVPAGANTLRLLPPLNVTDAEIDEALAILKDTLSGY